MLITEPSLTITPKTRLKGSPNLLRRHHHLLISPLKDTHHKTTSSTEIKAAKSPKIFPSKFQNPRKFRERDAFPHSIPIHSKNPHAIYRDIQRFANQNKLKEALTILDYLDKRGIPTNVTTFSALIVCCTRVKSLEAARQVHAHVRINGLEKNEFLQTKIVNMYASCGSMEDAKKVFDNMPVKSVYPWNALLRGSVVSGKGSYKQLLGNFSEMRACDVEPNVYSFSCMIKSVAGARSMRQGLKTHAMLVKNGLLESCIIRTSLIDMYFKCGKVELACDLFDEIEERDIVVWGAMISGFAHNRLQREALEYTRWMASEGIQANSVILTTILPVIGEVSEKRLGQEVHAYVIKTKEYSKQLFIQSSLVDMYCKCGDMGAGRKVFYGSKERNAISWTALMSGYVTNGRLEQALRSIIWMQQEGFKPDVVAISTVVPVCAKLRALKSGKELHAFVVKNGFSPGVSVATSLMMMYSKCGILSYCTKLFDNMEKKNVKAWTAMIECHIEGRCLDEALSVFRRMLLSKHRPDSVTIARVLSVCNQLRVQKLGKEIHAQVLKRDFESIPFVSSEIVKMYGNCGDIEKAKLSFNAISVKGSMTWTAIIEAYGFSGEYKEAVDCFEQMMRDGFTPNQFTFKAVLHVCERGGFVDDAMRFFYLMTRKYKVEACEEHYSIIVDLLARSGRTKEAEKFMQLRSALACS